MNELKSRNILYLIGLSGQNILYGIIAACLAYYYQFTLLIPVYWLGIILPAAQIFDAVKEPVVGAYINKSKYTLRKFLLYTPIPTAILTVLCFCNSNYSVDNSMLKNAFIIIYAFVIYIVWEIVFSLGDVPVSGYPTVLSTDENERRKMLSMRPIGAMVCSICCLVVQPMVFSVSDYLGGGKTEEKNAFFMVALFLSLVGGAMFQLTAIKPSAEGPKDVAEKNYKQIKYISKNPILKKVIVSGLVSSPRALTEYVMIPLVSYYFASKNPSLTFLYTFLLGTGNFVGHMVAVVFVPYLSKKYGNVKLYIISNIISAIPLLMIFVLFLFNRTTMNEWINFIPMFIFMLISGCFQSIADSVRTLIISDAVDYEEKMSGARPTALFFSFRTAMTKIGSGAATLISSLVYVIIGFTSEKTEMLNQYVADGFAPRLNEEYSVFMTALFFMFSVIPAMGSLLAMVPYCGDFKKGCKNNMGCK